MRKALRAYGLLFRWQFLRQRQNIPVLLVIQVALALGIVYGLAFLIPDIDKRSALFLATGAPTLTLLIMGLNVVPQEVSRAKLSGEAAYVATLPVPRLAPAAAEVSFWLLVQLPGTFLALLVASIRFDFALQVSPAVLPTMALVALSGASVGYALAMLLKPQVANQLGSFIGIALLLFSPINFPAERMPEALQAIHQVLPVKYMADLIRWSLTGMTDTAIGLAFAVVTAWCVAGIAMSWRIAARRL